MEKKFYFLDDHSNKKFIIKSEYKLFYLINKKFGDIKNYFCQYCAKFHKYDNLENLNEMIK